MENTNKTEGKTSTEGVGLTETQNENKCLFCNKTIGDGVSNYHIGCYKQKQLLDRKQLELEEDN